MAVRRAASRDLFRFRGPVSTPRAEGGWYLVGVGVARALARGSQLGLALARRGQSLAVAVQEGLL